MLHILTVHWKNEEWIDIQLDYFKRFISEEYRVYAFLNDIPEIHHDKFHYVSTEPIVDHPVKLNLLAEIARFQALSDEDLLLFIDGDAIPIGDVCAYSREKLAQYPLLAVQRLENNGDIQPHPAFAVTTIRFWVEIGGDWKEGHRWHNRHGELVSDAGGNLLGILNGKQIPWYPIKRSNRINLHTLWYGIYDDMIYHHGAGFRTKISRVDVDLRVQNRPNGLLRFFNRLASGGLLGKIITKLGLERKLTRHMYRRIHEENERQSREIFQSVREDPHFYRRFLAENGLNETGGLS